MRVRIADLQTRLYKVGKTYAVTKYHGDWKDAPTSQSTEDNMRKITGFFIINLLLSTNAIATESAKIPTDVQSFLNNADTCEHFASEWDNSLPKSRQKEIELSLTKYCSLAKKQQPILKEKYRNNTNILNSINNYDF